MSEDNANSGPQARAGPGEGGSRKHIHSVILLRQARSRTGLPHTPIRRPYRPYRPPYRPLRPAARHTVADHRECRPYRPRTGLPCEKESPRSARAATCSRGDPAGLGAPLGDPPSSRPPRCEARPAAREAFVLARACLRARVLVHVRAYLCAYARACVRACARTRARVFVRVRACITSYRGT